VVFGRIGSELVEGRWGGATDDCPLDDQAVVGVHALVEGAADLVGEAALSVRSDARHSDSVTVIHPHPTLTESFGLAASAAMHVFCLYAEMEVHNVCKACQ